MTAAGPWRARPGFVDPYTGREACARIHKYGHTFRWCKGDTWIGVQRGTVIDTRRVLIVRDTLAEHRVIDGPIPVVDLIPASGADWNDARALHRLADAWAAGRHHGEPTGRRPPHLEEPHARP